MKFSFRQLLLLVALATTTVFAKSETVETIALQGDGAADLSTLEIAQPSREVAQPTRAIAGEDKREAPSFEGDSRFIRTTNKALKYAWENRAFIMQRAARKIIIKWLTTLAEEQNFSDKLGFKKDSEANKKFVAQMIKGSLESAVITGLKTIETDEEHWFLSTLVAGLAEYCFEKDVSLSLLAAVSDYFNNPEAIKHWPKAKLLLRFLIPFINSEKIVKHFTSKDPEAPIRSLDQFFNPATGIGTLLSVFLAWDPKTRVNSIFEKGSFADTFVQNMIGRALIPATIGYGTQNFFPTPPKAAITGTTVNGAVAPAPIPCPAPITVNGDDKSATAPA